MRAEKAKDIEKMKEQVVVVTKVKEEIKKAGRPMEGKSMAKNKIAFVIDDEQLEWAKKFLDYDKKLTTPSAVAKMMFVREYELHKDD